MPTQTEVVNLEDLVAIDHPYRVYKTLLALSLIERQLADVASWTGPKGFSIDRLFLCLLLQFMEDVSDREAERFLKENTAAKWFCGFALLDKTPDHTVFCRARTRIGTHRLSRLFAQIRDQLSAQGYMNEVFTFVDATHLITKSNLWKERDQALKAKYDKLNNEVLPKVAADKQARIGCKGKDKYWYGYKQHTSVDMQSGLINKVAITPANLTDAQGMKHVCPNQGAVYGDKGYCTQPAQTTAIGKGLHLAAIKKNNMHGKNRDLDRWYSGIRSPYERVFSQRNHRVRYRGVEKNQFTAFMQGISFNLKRLRILNLPVLTALPTG